MRVQRIKRRVSQFVSSGDWMSLRLCILRFGDLPRKWSEEDNNEEKQCEMVRHSSEISTN